MIALERVKQVASRHQLTMAIMLTVVIALIMTGISLSLYVSSGTLQLDLSRPGYESVRKGLTKPQNKTDYATNGSIDEQALEEYQKLFDSQRTNLNRIGNFKEQALSDDSLTLSSESTQQN